MTETGTTSEFARAGPGTPDRWMFLLAVASVPEVQVLLAVGGRGTVPDGYLPGQDTYMGLVGVERLYRTGAWSDGALPRGNWPNGEILHWTRPTRPIGSIGSCRERAEAATAVPDRTADATKGRRR